MSEKIETTAPDAVKETTRCRIKTMRYAIDQIRSEVNLLETALFEFYRSGRMGDEAFDTARELSLHEENVRNAVTSLSNFVERILKPGLKK